MAAKKLSEITQQPTPGASDFVVGVTAANQDRLFPVSALGGGSSGITINTTTITGGTNFNLLYDNAGVVGELTFSHTNHVLYDTAAGPVGEAAHLTINGGDPDVNAVGAYRFAGQLALYGSFITNDWFDGGAGPGPGGLGSSGGSNLGTGVGALVNLTSGGFNTATGHNACNALTTGTNNVAVGSGACRFITTGVSNFGFGTNAMSGNGASSQNVAIGTGSLNTPGTYSSNTAVGHATLGALNGGSGGNVAIGEGAMQSATTADSCVCIGQDAGFNLLTQTGETLVGNGAGFFISSGSNNTMIGGHPGVATMSNCIVLSAGATIRLDYNFTTSNIWTHSSAAAFGGYAVGSLPTSPTGTIAYVTDGTAGLVNGNVVTGGHATPYLVWFNGTNWTVVGE